MNNEQYRLENESVFEYSEESGSYVFVGNLNGRDLEEFISDKFEQEMYELENQH